MIQTYIIVRTSGARFTTTYQTLNCEDVPCIDVTVFLLFQEFTDFCIFINNYLVFAIIEDLVETIDEMQEADYFFVTYGNVTKRRIVPPMEITSSSGCGENTTIRFGYGFARSGR